MGKRPMFIFCLLFAAVLGGKYDVSSRYSAAGSLPIVKCSNGRLECALLTWDHRKFWDFPFGKRDPGEYDSKVTATRESYELNYNRTWTFKIKILANWTKYFHKNDKVENGEGRQQ